MHTALQNLHLPKKVLLPFVLLLTLHIGYAEELWTGKRTQPTAGNGSIEQPYLISSPEELAWFAGIVNGNMGTVAQNNAAHARLTTDIIFNTDLIDSTTLLYQPQYKWTPIGNGSKHMYTGVFDGGGHVIKGLYGAHEANEDCNALFGYIGSTGRVCNVGLEDYYVASEDYTIAGIAAVNRGTINNCYVTGCITSTSSKRLAGVASANNDGGSIMHCYNAAYILQNNTIAGSGIVYNNYPNANIHNCFCVKDRATNGVMSDKSDRSQYTNKTLPEMLSGQVTWLLQNGQENHDSIIWGQLCGQELPQLTAKNQVCKISFVRKDVEQLTCYANKDSLLPLPDSQSLNLQADEMLFIGNKPIIEDLRVNSDMTVMIATPTHKLTLTANPEIYGTVIGEGIYPHGDTVNIAATPYSNYYFSKWSDGSKESVRNLVLTDDMVLTAYFMPFTAIANPETDSAWYSLQGRQLHMLPNQTAVQIYTLAGQCLYQGHVTKIDLPAHAWYLLQRGQQRSVIYVP